jgi:hypothetical protein
LQMRATDEADRVAIANLGEEPEPVDELAAEKPMSVSDRDRADFLGTEEGAAEDYLGPSVMEKIARGLDEDAPATDDSAETVARRG